MERPAYLSTLLTSSREKENRENDVQKKFQSAAATCDHAMLHNKYIDVCPTFAVTEASDEEFGNSSLCLMFDFYAKIQNPAQQLGVHAPTYDEIAFANSTLSFYELVVLCRDFSIIPALLSKDELRYLWRVTSAQWVKNGNDCRSLPFSGFPDFLARMAVLAYNKPMLRSVIMSSEGSMPSPADICEAFCTYLHLNDVAWVKNCIQTIGRETMKNLNFRSIGEVNPNATSDLRNELMGKRLSHYMSKPVNHHRTVKPASTQKVIGNAPVKDLEAFQFGDEDDENEEDNLHLSTEASQKELLKVASSIFLKNVGTSLPSPSPRKPFIPDSVSNSSASFVPDAIKGLPSGSKANVPVGTGTAASVASTASGLSQRPRGSSATAIVSEWQEHALITLDPSLKAVFLPYCVRKRFTNSSKNNDSVFRCTSKAAQQCHVKIGSVEIGRNCIIRLKVTNKSVDDVFLDATVRGIICDNVRVTMLTKALPPGLSRTISVSFTMDDGTARASKHMSLIGYIDISVIPVSGRIISRPHLPPTPFRTIRLDSTKEGPNNPATLHGSELHDRVTCPVLFRVKT